jgi:hypothetical protein
MFEKEIKFITDFNLNKIKKSGSFFTITHLAAANVHPAIIQYVSAELDYLISIDRNRLLQKSVFDYSGEVINNYLELISAEIKKEKLIPYEDIKRLISQAVEFNVYYLIRPRWCLKKFIYGDEEIRSHNEIKTYLSYTYFFDYYKNILQAILEKKKIVSISIYEFEDLIVNLEKQLIQKQQQTFIENALQSLAEFFNLGEIQKSKISVGIVEKFLYEKGLLNEIFKVRKLLSVDPKSKFEVEEFKQAILSNIFVETSDIEITEKIFEIPKTSFEEAEQIEVQEESEIIQPEFQSTETLTETKSEFIISEADNFEEEQFVESQENNIPSADNELNETEEELLNSEDEFSIINQVDEDESLEIPVEEELIENTYINLLDAELESEYKVEVDSEPKFESIDEVNVDSEVEEEITPEVEEQMEFQEVSELPDDEKSLEETENDLKIEEEVQLTEIEDENDITINDEVNISEELLQSVPEEQQTIEKVENLDEAVALYEEFLSSDEVATNDMITNDELDISEIIVSDPEQTTEKDSFDDSLISVKDDSTTLIIEEEEILPTKESDDSETDTQLVEQKDAEIDLLKTIEEEIENLQNSESSFVESEVNTLLVTEEIQTSDELAEHIESDLVEASIEPEGIASTPSYEVVDDFLEDYPILEIEPQNDIPEILDQNIKTEVIQTPEEISPIKYVVKASADEIFNLFTTKETTKIISSIFQKDELDFVHTVEQISECKSYKHVEEILNLVFHSYRINSLTQKDAIIFKEKIALYFKRKEK